MSAYTLSQKAKAIAAFVMAVATGLAGISVIADLEVADVNVGYVLAAVAAVASYVVTFKVPNAPTADAPAAGDEFEGTH